MTQETDTVTRTPWRLKAHNLESCNCNHGCGCQFGGFPDHGGCEAVVGYEVIEGHYGDVDLAGVQLVFAAKWPKAIHEGSGQGVLFIDESARPEQIEGLSNIFTGQDGGMPWEALAGTFDSFETPVLKPIEMTANGTHSSFRIPDILEVKLTPLKDPVTGEEKDVHIVYPNGGFLWNDGSIGTTETMQIDYGPLQYQYPGKFSDHAIADWTNQK